jgi:tetratricopeptide (TPR) repeat protein
MKRGLILIILLFLFFVPVVYADTALDEGIKLFRENKPDEARIKFEDALALDNRNEKIYYYLGIVYQQLNNTAKAVDILQQGILIATKLKSVLYYQIGVSYETMKDLNLAEKYYTLALTEDSLLSEPYLNRANMRVDLAHYKDAIGDYKTFLRLKPNTSKRPEIEKMIAELERGIDNQDQLLKNVLNSLKNASSEGKTNSAGVEGFKDTGTTDVDILD